MNDSRDDRFEAKLDKIVEKIGNIDITLVRQNATLEEHIRRTELLEKDVAPIKRKVAMGEGILKFIAGIAIFLSILELVTKMMAP